MRNPVTPRMEEFTVGESTVVSRAGVYVPVYERLCCLAEEHARLTQEEPEAEHCLRGLRVAFPTPDAGLSAIKRMGLWAREDGWCVMYGKHVNGMRELHLEPLEESHG